MADPLIALIGAPDPKHILPPPPEDTSYGNSIIVDLCHTNFTDSQLSLLWLLFLSHEGSRYLIAYIDRDTDPNIVQLLYQFHQLSGRCFCIRGFGLEELIAQNSQEDRCWVSSPSVIGPELLKRPIPLICLSCRDQKPIKSSWLARYNLAQLFEHLLTLPCIEHNGASQLARPESIQSIQIQLLTCTYRAKEFLTDFLAHSADWISTTALHGLEVVHTFLDVEPEFATRRQLLATLSQRKGFVLQLQQDPGLYGAWNTLIQSSEEEFISNANPDDCRRPDQLWHLIALLQAHPERMVASSVVVPIKQKNYLSWSFDRIVGRCRRRWFSDVDDGYGLDSLYLEPTDPGGAIEPHNIPHCSPVWRRMIHVQHGLFNEERYGSEADWGLWCKYAYHGGLFCHCDKPLSGYFINSSSYGRDQQSSIGFERIVRDFLHPTEPEYSVEQTSKREQIFIHGLNSYYGDHRISNNSILQSIRDLHSNTADLKFIWFIEGYFIWGEASGERRSKTFQAIQQPWFGVIHIPPLTPKWAGNLFAELFFLKEWKESLNHCRALISLSAYMAEDLKLIYPQLPIFTIKHPITSFSEKFEFESFIADPKVVLVGYWLRRHLRFYQWRAPLPKIHLLKKYTPDHMNWEMKAFGPLKPEEECSVTKYGFLPSIDYDRLLKSSLVYLSLYETSGNNTVIECISMATPFIADRHPAIEEYVGVDYPLLLEPGELERMRREELIGRAYEAHQYLMSHPSLSEDLSYERFRENICRIIATL